MSNSREIPEGQDWLIDRMLTAKIVSDATGLCRGRAVYETFLMLENNLDTLDVDHLNNTLIAASQIPIETLSQKLKALDWQRNTLAIEAKDSAFHELPVKLQKKVLLRNLTKEEQKKYETAIQQKWAQKINKFSEEFGEESRDALAIPAYMRGVASYQTTDANPATLMNFYTDYLSEQRKPRPQQLSKNLLDVVQPSALKLQGGLCCIDSFNGAYTKAELVQFFKGLRSEIDKNSDKAHPTVALLSGPTHTIMVGYDPSRPSWVFNDANGKGAVLVTDESMLADKVATGLATNNVVMEVEILASNRDSQQISKQISAWRNQPAMKAMHAVTAARNEIQDNQGASLLHIAAIQGDSETVDKLIKEKVNLNKTYIQDPERNEFSNALFAAVLRGHDKVVDSLLTNKPKDIFDPIAFRMAAERGYHKVVKCFLKHGFNPDDVIDDGRQGCQTPLFDAAKHGHTAVVKELLAHKADPTIGSNGLSPIFIASDNGHDQVVAELLKDPRTNVNAADNHGMTPLEAAAGGNHRATVACLLSSKEIAVDQADNTGNTALHHAAMNGHEAIVKTLLNNGADANLTNQLGETPLFRAAQKGKTGAVTALLDHEQTLPDKPNKRGQTPIQIATRNRHTETSLALSEHKTNPASHTSDRTPVNDPTMPIPRMRR